MGTSSVYNQLFFFFLFSLFFGGVKGKNARYVGGLLSKQGCDKSSGDVTAITRCVVVAGRALNNELPIAHHESMSLTPR